MAGKKEKTFRITNIEDKSNCTFIRVERRDIKDWEYSIRDLKGRFTDKVGYVDEFYITPEAVAAYIMSLHGLNGKLVVA